MSDNFTSEENGELEPIYLTDEEGNEYPYDLLDVIEYQGTSYAVLFPAEDSEEEIREDEDGVVILKITPMEDGSAEFEDSDDIEALDAVYDIFIEHVHESFNEQ